MTAATDRREVFLHAAAEAGLQAGIDAVFRMGVYESTHHKYIARRVGDLYASELSRVAEELEVKVALLLEENKARRLVRVRWVAMWLMRKRHRMSYVDLAHAFRRDHSTIIHGVRQVEKRPDLLAWGQMLLERGSVAAEAQAAS